MKRILLPLIIYFILCNHAFATQITFPTVYGPTSQVTNITLNGDNSAISNVVNGNLDNTNANTAGGYRFYQTVSSLPSAGNTGQVYFLTTDDSLNFDTGSTFIKTIGISGSPSQGNVVIYGASGLTYAVTGSSGNVLVSGGAGTNPTFTTMPASNISGLIPDANIGPILAAHNTTTQSFLASTWTQKTFGTVDKDSGSYWSSNTYTPLVAGWYLVSYTENITSSSAGGLTGMSIYKNGSSYATASGAMLGSSNTVGTTVTSVIQLNGSTDNVSFYVYSSAVNSSANSLNPSSGNGSFVSIVRVY